MKTDKYKSIGYVKGANEVCKFCGGRTIGTVNFTNPVQENGYHQSCEDKLNFQIKQNGVTRLVKSMNK